MAFPVRYVIILVLLMGTAIDVLNRGNLNQTLVAMTGENNQTSNASNNQCNHNSPQLGLTPRLSKATATIYDWDPQTQGLILGSFYWSYIFMQIPAGRFAEM